MKLHIGNKKGVDISKEWIGLFFEDINYGLDGGLHAEMIENRAFEFVDARGTNDKYYQNFAGEYGWSVYHGTSAEASNKLASMRILNTDSLNDINPNYMEFTALVEGAGLCNQAYEGIYMEAGLDYNVSFYAKSSSYTGELQVSVYVDGVKKVSRLLEDTVTEEWVKYKLVLNSEEEIRYGKFVIELLEVGTVSFDVVSMIPSNAVLGLFRKDLAELLKDMNPGFLRFPGGCIIEGNTLENRYQWKHSVGPLEERKSNWNRWAVHGNNEENNYTSKFNHYNQTLGIGYYEYFLLCEYLKADPVPVINVGLACQYQSTELVSVDSEEFKEYLQDALDLIEFANGAVDSKYGKLRAMMGHSEPFNMKHIGIGNEQWETDKVDFFRRYSMFEESIHKLYPDMKLIGSAGPNLTSHYYQDAWDFYHKMGKDSSEFTYAVDEHYYVKPEWLMENTHFYDNYDRNVKVFAGEYAAHCHNEEKGMKNDNYWLAGLSEAAFLTGIERNADVVLMASYAPLFARHGYSQWTPNLIWFDDRKAYGTPSYYVQQLFAKEVGEYTLQSSLDKEEVFHSSTYDEKEKVIYVKLVNVKAEDVRVNLELDYEVETDGISFVMKGDLLDMNSVDEADKVSVVENKIMVSSIMEYNVSANSFHVLKLKVK